MWKRTKRNRIIAGVIVIVLVAAMIVTFVLSALMGNV